MTPGEPALSAPFRRLVPFVACLALLGTAAALASPLLADPSSAVFVYASATGPIAHHPGVLEDTTVFLTDTLDVARAPRDTVPSRSRLDFAWVLEGDEPVLAYRYSLESVTGSGFVGIDTATVDTSVHSVSYLSGSFGTGRKVFRVRTITPYGDGPEITRYFQVNFSPDTWIAGPDPSSYGTFISIPDWTAMPDLSGTLLSCDSLTVLPAERPERRTFFELYEDQLHVRSDGDTVHMNSWVLVHGGGSDLDSPYLVKVGPGDPALDDTIDCAAAGTPWVVRPAGLNGSPIGFKSQYTVLLEGSSALSTVSQSTLFPNFDPASVFRNPVIGAYAPMKWAGNVYFVLRSQDSDGAADNRIPNPRALVEAVDAGMGTPEQIALRPKVLVFHVNYAPYLRYGEPFFSPQPNQAFPTRTLDLHLLASDLDPYDPGTATPPGGGSPAEVLRWNVTLIGRNAYGEEVVVSPLPGPVFDPDVTVEVPPQIVGPDILVQVELCDCAVCGESQPGVGSCVYQTFPVTVPQATAGVETPRRAELAVEGLQPNPTEGGELTVHFSLASGAPARLELLDVTGRRQYVQDVGALGAGRHSIRLSPERRVSPGIYLIRLHQGGVTRTRRAAVIR